MIDLDSAKLAFDLAMAQPPDLRHAHVAAAHADEPELQRIVLGLLDAHEAAPIIADLDITTHARPGDQIGRYRLIRVLGEGGFGVVYLAEQTAPFRRQVALKLIRPGMDTKSVLARFENERHALALMDHPNVARVHDAGVTEHGLPYFVMEHVDGDVITSYCDTHRLDIHQRLTLFRQACAAAAHAHQRGLIHRDLKPANLLVEEMDGAPIVRVIDFGIAKALSTSRENDRRHTMRGEVVGTLAYMAPEQRSADWSRVDVRSDIYTLGVVLHELLSGAKPRHGEADDLTSMSRAVERLPADERRQAAECRDEPTERLAKTLRGDLDCIVRRTTDDDPERRYASADALSADVGRYLATLPIEARAPSRWYVSSRFVQRHRTAAIGVAIIVLLLVASAAISITFGVQAGRAKAAAQRNATEVRDITTKLLFEFDEQLRRLPRSTPARRSLVTQTLTYLERLGTHADCDIEVLRALAHAYWRLACIQGLSAWENLGDREGALRSLEASRSYALRWAEMDPDAIDAHRLIGRIGRWFALLAIENGDAEHARLWHDRAVSMQLAHAARHENRADLLYEAIATRWVYAQRLYAAGRHDDLEAIARDAAAVLDGFSVDPDSDPHLLRWQSYVLSHTGRIFSLVGRYDEAIALFERARVPARLARDAFPDEFHCSVAETNCLRHTATALMRKGEPERAAELFDTVLLEHETHIDQFPGNRALLGTSAQCHLDLGTCLAEMGHSNEAVSSSTEGVRSTDRIHAEFPDSAAHLESALDANRQHARLMRFVVERAHQAGEIRDAWRLTAWEEEAKACEARAAELESRLALMHEG